MKSDRAGPTLRGLTWADVDAEFPAGIDHAGSTKVDQWLRTPAVQELVRAAVRRACRRFSLDWETHHEDFENEALVLLFLVVTDPAARASWKRIDSFSTAVLIRTCDRVKAITESSEWIGSTGMSGRARRRRLLAMHRAVMVEQLGREPSHTELIESFNAAMQASRANAVKQGVVASAEDLTPLGAAPLLPELDVPSAHDEDDTPLCAPEARGVLESSIRRASALGGVTAEVVRAWLGNFDAQPPYIATTREIAQALQMHPDTVRAHLVTGRQIVRDVLREEYGITEDGYHGKARQQA